MTRKELQKQQYSQLRAAGFSVNVARRFRGSSQQKIDDIIKRGTGAELPEKSIKKVKGKNGFGYFDLV